MKLSGNSGLDVDVEPPEAVPTLGRLEIGVDMVERAVTPCECDRALEVQDRDVVLLGEVADVAAAELVVDLLDDDRRGDRLAQVDLAEPLRLVPNLEVGAIRVQVRPVQSTYSMSRTT
jgi:hypothetical protein